MAGLFALALGLYALGFTILGLNGSVLFGLAANPSAVAGLGITSIAAAIVLSIEAMGYSKHLNSLDRSNR